jgi:hypothetical protein
LASAGVAAVILLSLGAQASDRVRESRIATAPVTVYLRFEHAPPADFVATISAELETLMAPAVIRLDCRLDHSGGVSAELVVVSLKGSWQAGTAVRSHRRAGAETGRDRSPDRLSPSLVGMVSRQQVAGDQRQRLPFQTRNCSPSVASSARCSGSRTLAATRPASHRPSSPSVYSPRTSFWCTSTVETGPQARVVIYENSRRAA